MRFKYKLYLDGLPSATIERNLETGVTKPNYDDGVSVGVRQVLKGIEKYVLYNHWIITVKT